MYCLFCDVLCIVCVYMRTELLPPGGYPIAIKYIISYHIKRQDFEEMHDWENIHIHNSCEALDVEERKCFCPPLDVAASVCLSHSQLCNDILSFRYSAKNEFTIGTDLLWDYLAVL